MSRVSETLPSRRGPITVTGGVFVAFLLRLTALGVLGGSVGWTLVRRFSPDPERLLRRLVPSVVVLSCVPDFFLFGEGEVTGVVALLLMHVAVAVIAVPTYYRVMPLSSVR
ncbi:DUF6069 family protein [Streptomyces sp. SudanB52_2052]|uniref:DUF6069 family protein n=1 Tax=Streptomyces sp. SudanB52_2052 TaxID=3035276 RepID=UPI003F554BDC